MTTPKARRLLAGRISGPTASALCAIAVALTMPCIGGSREASAQARWVVKLGTDAFERAPAAELLARIAERLEAEHPGRFWVKRFADGALARQKPALARVSSGEVHGYAASYDELVAAMPDAIALSAPFAFDNERDADAVLRTTGSSALGDALAAQGMRLIAIAPCESRVLAARGAPVRGPADAKDRSVLRGELATHAALASALAMKPVEAVEQPEIHDGTLSELAASGALYTAQHVTLTDHALECGALVLSQRWIDGLPEQMQKSVGKLSRELGEEATRAQRSARKAILERLGTLGIEVIELGAKERRAFVEATRDARAKLNGEPGSLARKLTLAAQAK